MTASALQGDIARRRPCAELVSIHVLWEGWGNEFIPCIYPEAVYSCTKDRYIERNEKNYTDSCIVAKRNIGSSGIVMVNSWNDYSHDSALEPAKPWGEKYLDITRRELKQ